MNFQKVNNITGWFIGLFASAVYILTMEPTGSLWDCGEFVSSAFKLGIPHPPGAPLFILLGRIFTLFTPGDAAVGVNLLSALASGFTIMFLFWTITHFSRRLVQKSTGELTGTELFNVIAAGVIGSLAYTFSDSFWYSAVEGEVYALSSFFTAVVFWAILRWEHEDGKAGADDARRTHAERWIILIAFLMGLSIGVHLLNLLTIPAIVMVYYFRRYTPTWKGGIIAFLIGCAITGIVQVAVIQWSIGLAGWFDRLFVNSFGLPFFTGFAFFFIAVAILIWFGLRWANANSNRFLRLGLWSFAFMLVGYSTYLTTMIRSNANPAIDMNDVNNPLSLVSYLNREQYGDIPLLKGQMFTAEADYEEVGDVYQRVGNRYEVVGKKRKAVYPPEQTMVFPRLWDASNEQGHADYYAQFLGIEKLQDKQTGRTYYERDPDMADNIKFFFGYQINIMYWRYFMWNFAGKQNDVQGLGERRNGNWISGISFLDNLRLGNQKLMPESLKNSKANNQLYLLPFVLGVLGFAFQYYKHRRDWVVAGLLFFFTGLAIVLYLNQAGPQPRERDYAYVGSFYAFAIWIGLGFYQVKEWLEKLVKGSMASYLAGLLCLLAVPALMAFQEWDDHDRSKKTIAPDLATNYLESCAPNAILFTVGDNDTYPLWYAQEVLGIRPDVRVINTSLLGTDWYINQLRYKVNQSDPIDVIWTPEQIAGDKRNVVYYIPVSQTDTSYYDLYKIMKEQAGSDEPGKMYRTQSGDLLNYIYSNKLSVPVDRNAVLENGTVNATDEVLPELRFQLRKGYLFKNDAAILNIIAANQWRRPIYFTQPLQIGFDEFLRQDGLSFRLVPVANVRGTVNTEWMLNNILTKFKYGGATRNGVYFDEENRRHMLSIRNAHTILAMSLIADGRKEDAKRVLRHCDEKMPAANMPYAMASRYGNDHNEKSFYFAMTAYQAGDSELGNRVMQQIKKDCQQQVAFYESLKEEQIGPAQQYEYQTARQMLQGIEEAMKEFAQKEQQPAGDSATNKETTPLLQIP
ncbi:MAG TPA: DUF2723 domain-containing protein [Lacibacter sp.]|nr:DUF2723 domain-containing protein [Lacibacter sp.]HMO89111.1 DUF2723 domain-containing protein [Lacibacter sp.]